MGKRKVTVSVFYCYLFMLVWCILFKFDLASSWQFGRFSHINWIPYSEPLMINHQIVPFEMIFNVLLFVPFGLYLKILDPSRTTFRVLSYGILTSFLLEALQFLTGVGMADITDIIHNGLGTLVGLVFYAFLKKCYNHTFVGVINGFGVTILLIGFAFAVMMNTLI
ncbi:VanZ family protein [Streptococcus castoreus]|uniref:VanZ family protein n=1 Tax=Streptococcus castoreus TaxID=254786 RepID=UPI000419FBA6|nr:VanZ family protein [Streptococcus castoreus]